MLQFLIAMEFRNRRQRVGSEILTHNFALRYYEPHLSQLTLSAPKNTHDSYIFLHANIKIQNLNIYGDFGSSKETGLVWTEVKLDVINLIMEMNTSTNFYIARWVQRVNLLYCYINVQTAVINVAHFNYTSLTQSTLRGSYILHNGIPHPSFTRDDAMFAKL